MAWERKQNGSSFISGSTIYCWEEVDWNVEEAQVSYGHRGGVYSPFSGWNTSPSGYLSYREWVNGAWTAWTNYKSGTEHFTGGDLTVVSTTDSWVRKEADREVQLSFDVSATSSTGSGSDYTIMGYTVPHLAGAITSLTATRVNDNQVNLSWTKPATAIDGVQLQVSIDGSAWSSVTTLGDSSSCQYKYASSDHSYRFRVRATYQGSYGAWSNDSATITMKPAPIRGITTKAAGGTSVDIVLNNPSNVATKVQYQVSNDNGATWGATQDSPSLTGFTVTITGTGKVKAWNYNATGTSAPIMTDTIVTICPPAAPSPVSPQDGATVQAGDVTFSWDYITLDGSDQTAWELDYTTDDWTTTYPYYSDASTAGDTSLTITIPSGFTVKWKVRTKGAATTPNSGWSDWCAVQTFYSYAVPTITFASPSHITGMPIDVVARFTDLNGTCRAANVTVSQGGRSHTYYDPTIDNASTPPTITQRITLDEFQPADDPDGTNPVTITVYAGSSTGLSATANTTISPSFTEPAAGTVTCVNDPDTGYASLLATFDNHATDVEYSGATNAQFDTTAGYVRSMTVEGQSQKWNQLVNRNYADASITSSKGITFSVSNGYITASGDSTANGSWTINSYGSIPMLQGHKYLLTGIDAIDGNTSFRIYSNNPTVTYVAKSTTTDAIFTADTASNSVAVYFLFSGPRTGITFKGRPSLTDLTAIYGAGNEPTALTDPRIAFLKAYVLAHPAYDAGSLISIGGDVLPWNQLFDNSAASENVNGTTFTNNEDGTWNVTGAYSSNPFKYVTDAPMQPSHQLLVMQGTNPSNAYVRVGFDSYVGATWRNTKIASGTMEILSSYSSCDNIKPFVFVDGGWIATDDIKLTPRIIDLTAIYGAGNEPTSTSDARITALATYAATHYDYEANGVMDTSTGGVVVTGRNQMTLFSRSFTDTAFWDTITTSYLTQGSDGWVHVEVNNTGNSTIYVNFTTKPAAKPGTLKPSTDYTFLLEARNFSISSGTLYTVATSQQNDSLVDAFSNDSTRAQYISGDGAFTLPSRTRSDLSALRWFTRGFIAVGAGVSVSADIRISLYEGTYTGAFEPYIAPTTIPALLRSAGTVHDQLQVDKTDVQVARKVGYVDLGSLSWYVSGTNQTGVYRMTADLDTKKTGGNEVANMLCVKYEPTTPNKTYTCYEGMSANVNSGQVNIYDPNYNASGDAAAFKTAMSGVYLFYELATPTTDTLPDISLIELGTAATVLTDLDSTFTMTGWDGSADAVSISVARVNADGLTPLITDGASGAGAVDKYAPLNKVYQYAVTTKSSADAVKTVYVDNEIVTDLWFAYWTHKDGDTVTEMTASAKWNPDNGGLQLTRPQKTRVYYAGRKDPVSYDGSAVALSETPSWMLVDRSEVQPFVQLVEDGGRGVYKSCDGWVYHADFDLTLTPKYTAIGYYGGIMLSVTRIAGDQL